MSFSYDWERDPVFLRRLVLYLWDKGLIIEPVVFRINVVKNFSPRLTVNTRGVWVLGVSLAHHLFISESICNF